jgi:2-polyprenyl-6-hydroxyphenyl methylase/3-demethylubiquinone-9 3-methyltransferase
MTEEKTPGDLRFDFGANWGRFLESLTLQRIESATTSLREGLGVSTLEGVKFLDVGSGSGLFSLAARRLGARVHSVDFDPGCVGCAQYLRREYDAGSQDWRIEQGSILDAAYVSRLGEHDVVYSWGVLHHTGNMHDAFENVARLVSPSGLLFISIYNDQGWLSRYWRVVKRLYNRGSFMRVMVIAFHSPLIARWYLIRLLTGRLRPERGMAVWTDIKDWLGGYPFEVAKTGEVIAFFAARGFTVLRVKDVGTRSGCNEFVFRRAPKDR